MIEFYFESFENGRKIGGFVVTAMDLAEAFAKASKNIEVITRPHVTEMTVRTLEQARMKQS